MQDKLTDIELDALKEIFNIGIGRAANSLNKMVSETIGLTVPNVEILPSKTAKDKFELGSDAIISAVVQNFTGDFNGQALLMFSKDNGLELVRGLLGNSIPLDSLSELEQDSLVEVGNVVLNACFGTVINFLKSKIDISIPEFYQGSLDDIFSYSGEEDWSLYIEVKFDLPVTKIEGYIYFLMDIQSLEVFKSSVKNFVCGLSVK